MNTFLTNDVILKETLVQFENEMVMGNLVYKGYTKEFKKVGESVSIRKPVRYRASDSQDITNIIGEIKEQYTEFPISHHKVIPMSFTQRDRTLKIEEFSSRYIKPAAEEMANEIDSSLCAEYINMYHAVGTAGTAPSSFNDLGQVGRLMDEIAFPRTGRKLVLNPEANWALANGLKGLYNPDMVKDYIQAGYLGTVANMNIHGDQNIYTHTAGTAPAGAGNILIDSVGGVTYITGTAANVESSTLYVDTETGTLTVGDLITIAGVYTINPRNRRATRQLQKFVVKTAVTLDGTDDGITVSPAIRPLTSDPYQNVDAAPVADAIVTKIASHAANLAFVGNALGFVMIPEEKPDGGGVNASTINENGYSMSLKSQFDIKTNQNIWRLDATWGTKLIYPDLACRVLG